MTAIRFAGVCPHPPLIIHEVGRGQERECQRTIDALEHLTADLATHLPETVLLMATHGPLKPGSFFLLTATTAEGDLSRWGAPQLHLHFQCDPELAAAIRDEAEQAGTIRFGAEDGAEMGAHHHKYYSLKIEAVLEKIQEFLPVGIEPVLIQDRRLLNLPPEIKNTSHGETS